MNENNLKETNVSTTNTNKKNGGLIIIIIILLAIIVMGLIYFLVIKKTENSNSPTPTATPAVTPKPTEELEPVEEPTPTPNANAKNKFLSNKTYTSKDGKTTLTINKIDPLEDKDDGYCDVHATYKGKKYTFYLWDSSITDDIYMTLEGSPDEGYGGQCAETGLLLNLNTKTIENESHGYFSYEKTDKGYFFYEGHCLGGHARTAYDSNWKELGRLIYIDPQGFIYVLNDKKIIEYDVKGNKISENTTEALYTAGGVVVNDTFYYISYQNKALYLINNDTNEKVKIQDLDYGYDDNKDYDPFTGLDAECGNVLIEQNGKLEVTSYGETDYIFDLNTNQLTKVK